MIAIMEELQLIQGSNKDKFNVKPSYTFIGAAIVEMILGDALDAKLVVYKTAGFNNVLKNMTMLFSNVYHILYLNIYFPGFADLTTLLTFHVNMLNLFKKDLSFDQNFIINVQLYLKVMDLVV